MTDNPFATIHPIVLAAGRSERMGQPKLLMEFDGKKCITLVVESCITAALGTPIVVLGHFREQIEALLPGVGVTKVFNPDYTLGQTTSLKAGVAALPESAAAFIIYPADMPLITGNDLRALANAFVNRTEPTRTIFAPSYRDRGGHPVLVDARLKPEFLALDDLAPISDVIRKDRSRRAFVPVSHRGILLDMDTRRDYDNAVRELRGTSSHTTRRVTTPFERQTPAPEENQEPRERPA